MGKYVKWTEKKSILDWVRIFVSEVFGTLLLLFLGCMGCVADINSSGVTFHLQACLSFGFTVLLAVQIFGHISGSHINPSVTLAAAILGNISIVSIPVYLIAQFTGAIAGFSLLMAVTPPEFMNSYTVNEDGTKTKNIGVCSPGINSKISPFQGCVVEFMITALLIFLCCAVWDPRNDSNHDSIPIKFGLAVAGLALAAGSYTGANMNPARSLAPAMFNRDWKNHWVYWVGPLTGSLFASLTYRLLWQPPKPEDSSPSASA